MGERRAPDGRQGQLPFDGLPGPVLPDSVTAPAPTTPVDTSVEAAGSLDPLTLTGLRRRVLLAVAAAPDGLTADQVEVVTGLKNQTVTPRLWELCGLNRRHPTPALIERSSDRRPTRSGRSAHVYRLTDLGQRLLAEAR